MWMWIHRPPGVNGIPYKIGHHSLSYHKCLCPRLTNSWQRRLSGSRNRGSLSFFFLFLSPLFFLSFLFDSLLSLFPLFLFLVLCLLYIPLSLFSLFLSLFVCLFFLFSFSSFLSPFLSPSFSFPSLSFSRALSSSVLSRAVSSRAFSLALSRSLFLALGLKFSVRHRGSCPDGHEFG